MSTKVQDSGSTPPQPPLPPNSVIAGGYGAAIVAMFIDMLKYAREMQEQGYDLMKDSAQAMMGTEGQNGLINSWLKSGFDAADAMGDQLKDQANQSLVTAITSGVTAGVMLGGFAYNCTNVAGKLGERAGVSEEFECAKNYKTMLSQSKGMEAVVDTGSAETGSAEADAAVTARKEALKDGSYNVSNFGKDAEDAALTRTAAKQLTTTERAAALAKAEKQLKNLQARLDGFHQRQNTFVNYANIGQQAANAGGGYHFQMEAATDATKSGADKAQAEVAQTAVSTVSDNEQKAASNAQTNRDTMAQMAQALASALNAQVQSRA